MFVIILRPSVAALFGNWLCACPISYITSSLVHIVHIVDLQFLSVHFQDIKVSLLLFLAVGVTISY